MTRPTNTEIRQFAFEVVVRLREAGHEAVWAGGCVRDLLRNETPKDYDVATSANPKEVQKLFRRTYAVGAAFGVICVVGPKNVQVEVATFRADAGYSDGRRPDSVRFTDAREDALRRDFTINGMFFDPLEQAVIDFVGGRDDLEQGVVRCIGNPAARIEEDKLRMLRAVRFAARFGFAIEAETEAAIRAMAPRIEVVSAERILMELKAMLTAPSRGRALKALRSLHLLEQVLPEVAPGLLASEESWDRTLLLLENWVGAITLAEAITGLVLFLGDGAAGAAESILQRLKSTTADRDTAGWILRHLPDLDAAESRPPSHFKRLFLEPACREMIALHAAARYPEPDPDAKYARHLLATWSPEEINPAPLVTGQDLIRSGMKPGPHFKPLLEQLRTEQLDGDLTSHDQAMERMRELLAGS